MTRNEFRDSIIKAIIGTAISAGVGGLAALGSLFVYQSSIAASNSTHVAAVEQKVAANNTDIDILKAKTVILEKNQGLIMYGINQLLIKNGLIPITEK